MTDMSPPNQPGRRTEDIEIGLNVGCDEAEKQEYGKTDSEAGNDPFGNDATAEVKYRTMKWW